MEESIANTNLSSDKHIFVNPNEREFECLELFFKKQLEDGQGECFLEVGVGEGQPPGLNAADLEASCATVQALAHRLSAQLLHLRDRLVGGTGAYLTDPKGSASPSIDPVGPSSSPSVRGDSQVADPNQSVTPTSPPETTETNTVKRRQQRKRTKQARLPESPTRPGTTQLDGVDSQLPQLPASLMVREYLLRQNTVSEDFVDVRVAVVGNVDAGKSTLLGVLTHGELDNGRGLARLRLFRHKHEVESGRTSAVSNDILGFDANGQVVNRPTHGHLDWTQICAAAAKVVTFIDLAGHERYLKTTIFGMTGHAPDYAMLMVGANAGMIGMAKEHLGLALALAVPVFVVVTKVDMCPPNVMQQTMNLLFRILKSPGCRKMPLLVTCKDDVICSATNFTSERMCPIFTVSNVTGEHLDLLTMFLNLLGPRSLPKVDEPAHFQIDDIFVVQGAGTVVSGTCLSGVIKLNDTLLLGPDTTGQFVPVPVRSIHRKRMPVTHVRGGQTASFALKRLKRNQIRKGMVLVAPEMQPQASLEFTAEVLILHHPTTIWVGYQAMVHAGPVRQSATIIALGGKDRLRTGDKDQVQFRFMKHPEYLHRGLRLIFREGKTKAVGTVTSIIPYIAPTAPSARSRTAKKHQQVMSRTVASLPVSTTSPQSAVTTTSPTTGTTATASTITKIEKPFRRKRQRYERSQFTRVNEDPTSVANCTTDNQSTVK